MMLHKRLFGLRYVLALCFILPALWATGVDASSFWDKQTVLKDGAIAEIFGDSSKPRDIRITVAKVIKFLFGFIGIVMLVMIMISGFKIMTAGGDAKAIADAKGTLTNLILGFLLIVSAYAITDFIINSMTSIANDSYYDW